MYMFPAMMWKVGWDSAPPLPHTPTFPPSPLLGQRSDSRWCSDLPGAGLGFSHRLHSSPTLASCSQWGLPAVLGLQKLLGCGHEAFAGSGRTLYFFISYGLSPLASRKPLFKINTGKMCYAVSYNTIQPSIKYQTLFKQSSWLDWQIYKSKEIQRGGPPLSPPTQSPCPAGRCAKWPGRGSGRVSSFSSGLLLSYKPSVNWGYW